METTKTLKQFETVTEGSNTYLILELFEEHKGEFIALVLFNNSQYVTYACNSYSGFFWGHYYGADLAGAMADYKERITK